MINDRGKNVLKQLIKKCIDNKILLPGVTTLNKFISTALIKSDEKLWYVISSLADSWQLVLLEDLLKMDDTDRNISKMELLKKPITSESQDLQENFFLQ